MVKGKVILNTPAAPSPSFDALLAENEAIRRRLSLIERSLRLGSTSPSLASEQSVEDRMAGVMEEVALGIGEKARWQGANLVMHPEVRTHSTKQDNWYRSVPLDACLAAVPSRAKSACLVSFFAQDLAWLVGALHIPSFLERHDEFWATAGQETADDVWLAILFAVYSMAGFFMEDSQAQLNGFMEGELEQLARTWFDCSIATLYRNDFVSHPSLASIQAVQILMYPFHLSGNTAIHPTMHEICIQTARLLNLHLLGSSPERKAETGGRDDLAREIGRRVWWNLVEVDWVFLPYHRYCCESMRRRSLIFSHRGESLQYRSPYRRYRRGAVWGSTATVRGEYNELPDSLYACFPCALPIIRPHPARRNTTLRCRALCV
jgi:hypothetical protein